VIVSVGVGRFGEDLGIDVGVVVDVPGGLVAVRVVQVNGDARQRSLLLVWEASPVMVSAKRAYRLSMLVCSLKDPTSEGPVTTLGNIVAYSSFPSRPLGEARSSFRP
jgi:hypothetical protein